MNNLFFSDEFIMIVLSKIGIDNVSVFTFDFTLNQTRLNFTSDPLIAAEKLDKYKEFNDIFLSVYGVDFTMFNTELKELRTKDSLCSSNSFSVKRDDLIFYYGWFASITTEEAKVYILDVSAIERNKLKIQDLKLKQELKSEYISNLLHEIRNPINAIMGFSELIAENVRSKELNDYQSVIKKNSDLLQYLIKENLDFSAMERKSINLNIGPVDINEICREVYLANSINFNSNVQLIYEPPGKIIKFQSDRHRLIQVLNNFIGNALKFTRKGSVSISYKQVDNSQLQVLVSDTGIGIPPEKAEMIFNRYAKLDKKTSGYGLGLNICKNIIHALGGKIGVESIKGVGSTFWFKLKILQ